MKDLWLKIPEAWRKEIVSFAQTFIAVFGASFFAQLGGEVEWSSALLASALVAASRSALKAAMNRMK